MRSPKVCFSDLLELPISFCAKNASTTTMRIGNAALLKNLLMRKKCVRSARLDSES